MKGHPVAYSQSVIAELMVPSYANFGGKVHPPHQRQRLERLCRYATRPAICLERLPTDATVQVVYEFKNPCRDGATHSLFTPEDFLTRLASLVPRPRANLTRYHGVFAANSPFRRAVVPGSANLRHKKRKKPTNAAPAESAADEDSTTAPLTCSI